METKTSMTGRSYWKKLLASTLRRLTLYIHVFVAAIVSSVKHFKWCFLRQTPDLTPPQPSRPCNQTRPPAWLTSTISTHLNPNCPNSRGLLFSLTPFAPWDEDSRTTHTLVAKNPPPPSLPSVQRDWMWIIQNWFLSTLNDNCSYRHKNTKVLFNIYIFSPQVVSKRVSPQRALRNELPCADRYQCMPSLYSWKMHMSNSVAFPVQQVSKIFYKQIKCSNIYP